jgi:hypothetical protein
LTEAVKRENRNKIGLREDSGTIRSINVPPGLTADIVRRLWETKVIVRGPARNGVKSLREIVPAENGD